ncbi:MAG: TonB-dependent receptor [Candidatus Eremiobacteraeota bacterium]|nr:TonB-dependent receptor [Candidatus Eremiobacteraeota bacterium]
MPRYIRALQCALIGVLLTGVFPANLSAQESTGSILVQVVDVATQRPLRGLAKLTGPLSTTRSTDANGDLEFAEVPTGVYRVQAGAPAYKSSEVVTVNVQAGERSVVRFELAKRESALKTIGRVSTTRSRARPYSDVSRNGALAHVSENLYDALGKLPGVSLDTLGDFGQGQALYGLEGHDPAQTAITLDGIPLNSPGSAFDASVLGGDLMSSASVSFGPAQGFSAGSVDFRTALPTRYPLLDVVARAGASGSSALTALARGSSGSLGYVVGGGETFSDLEITGQTFADWSGQTISHRGGSGSRTALAKLQYLAGSADTVSATFLRTDRAFTPFCPYATTVTRCSFGTAAAGGSSTSILLTRWLGQRENFTYDLAVFRTASSSATDLSARTIAGVPFPAASQTALEYGGGAARLSFAAGARSRFDLSFVNTSTQERLGQSALGSSLSLSGTTRNDVVDVVAVRELSNTTRATLRVTQRHGIDSRSTSFGARADARLDANSTLSASADVGAGAGALSVTGLTSTPDFLNYLCAGRVAYGRLGTVVSENDSTSTQRLAYTRTTPASAYSLVAFDQIAHNVPMRYPVNGADLGFLDSSSFLTDANRIAHLPTVCPGSPPLTSQDIYLFGPMTGIDTRYSGLRAIGSVTKGPIRVDPFVSLIRARLASTEPFVTSPRSILRPGMQLFGVPYVQAGALVDYKNGPLEVAANYRYYSENNSLDARAFGTLDVGAVFTSKRGAVTVRATNVTNALASSFATVGALSATTIDGRSIPLVARPFPGRRISVEYSTVLGVADRGAPTARAFTGGTETPRPVVGLPSGPVSAPFALRNDNPACDFETAKKAEAFVAPLRAYYEFRLRNGTKGVPPPPALADTMVAYHDVPNGYELEYTLRTIPLLSTVIKCLHYRSVDEKDLTAAGLIGSATNYNGISFLFSSTYGFILPTTKEKPSPPQYYAIGRAIPKDPFALTTAPSCSARYHDRAAALLANIRDELTRRGLEHPFSTDAFDVKVGTKDSLPWVYLEFKSQFDLAAILNCGHISQGNRDELGNVNLGGAALPYLAFSPAYGFFFLRL